MSASLPQLVQRIVRSLARGEGPRSSADLAREFLGLGFLEEDIASELIDPALSLDSRLVKTPEGWRLQPGGGKRSPAGGIPLTAPFLAVFTHPERDTFAIQLQGASEPLFTISTSGERELLEYERRSGQRAPRPLVSLVGCARRLRGYRGPPDLLRLAEKLGAPHVEGDTLPSAAGILVSAWEHLAGELALEGIADLESLDALMDDHLERTSFEDKDFDEETLLGLPEQPGLYIFSAFDGRTLYVGQSVQLRARVCSYFRGPPRDEKDRAIREQATRLSYRVLDTGLDALIVEARSIRRLVPAFNTQRQLLSRPGEDGILLVPATGQAGRAVLYTVAQGLLRRRTVTSPGPRRNASAARRAVEALLHPPDVPSTREQDAALAATWRRTHPQHPFFRLGFDGDAAALRDGLGRALGALATQPW